MENLDFHNKNKMFQLVKEDSEFIKYDVYMKIVKLPYAMDEL